MKLVAIGGSAGSLDALRALLPSLPTHASVAIVIHIPPHQPSLLAEVLGGYCRLPVVEAIDKLALAPGIVVVAPPDYHLLIERERTVALSRDPVEHFSRPAIDALFVSAAQAVGADVVGVLLTGANEDGAAGLLAIKARGGATAVQDPKTALAPEMPRAALELFKPDLVADPARIGAWLATVIGAAE